MLFLRDGRDSATRRPDVAGRNQRQSLIKFSDLGLSAKVLSAVHDAGYTEPTPIQAGAIPPALQRKDVLGIAQTGTGKTAAFVLPMITQLERGRARARMPRTLILEPTRELAAQVEENFIKYGKNHKLNVSLLIGGVSFDEQLRKLQRGADVLIATPGRLLDHFERGKLLLTGVETLVIDEADRMLDMGFIPDIERICKLVPFTRQTLFFSATMPPEITRITEQFLQAPVRVEVSKPSSTSDTITQMLVKCPSKDFEKRARLRELINSEEAELKNGIVFCNRKKSVSDLHKSLVKHGYDAGALHGDMDQRSRMTTLDSFRNGTLKILVASDVAARGLDIPDVSHVFNFDVPTHAEDYVHRIGRTGRAGRKGAAFTLVTRAETKYLDSIFKLTGDVLPWKDGDLSELAPSSEDDAKPRRGRGGKSGNKPDTKTTSNSDDASRDSKPKRSRQPKAAASQNDAVTTPSETESVVQAKPAEITEKKTVEPATQTRDVKTENKPNNKRRSTRKDRGTDNDNGSDATKGFGDEIPAFMLIGS